MIHRVHRLGCVAPSESIVITAIVSLTGVTILTVAGARLVTSFHQPFEQKRRLGDRAEGLARPPRLERARRYFSRSRPRPRHRCRRKMGARARRCSHPLRGGAFRRFGGMARLEMVRRRIPTRQQAQ